MADVEERLVVDMAVDPDAMTDGQRVDALLDAHVARARLDGWISDLTDVVDHDRVWEADGARSAASWVSSRADIGFAAAASEVKVARALRVMPGVAAAARSGRLGREKVKALIRGYLPGLEGAFAACEETLVDEVERTTVAGAHRFVRRWVLAMCAKLGINPPDGPGPGREGTGPSRLHLSCTFEGRWSGTLDLTALDGETIAGAIDGQVDAMWRAGAFQTDDGLTPAERRAAALVEVVTRGVAADGSDGARPLVIAVRDETGSGRACRHHDGRGDDSSSEDEDAVVPSPSRGVAGPARTRRRARPPAVVDRAEVAIAAARAGADLDVDRLPRPDDPTDRRPRSGGPTGPDEPPRPGDGCARAGGDGGRPADEGRAGGPEPPEGNQPLLPVTELARSGPVPREIVDLLACEGDTVPLTMIDGPIRDDLHHGRALRVANAAQRRALRIRDGHCVFPGCHVAPDHCIAHHVTWWEDGGLTDIANLVLLCRFHHRAVHIRGFVLTLDAGGRVVVTRPDGVLVTPARADRIPVLSRNPFLLADPPVDPVDPVVRAVRRRVGDLVGEATQRRIDEAWARKRASGA
jgi:hypothetical protein